jgi:hypothetical protein
MSKEWRASFIFPRSEAVRRRKITMGLKEFVPDPQIVTKNVTVEEGEEMVDGLNRLDKNEKEILKTLFKQVPYNFDTTLYWESNKAKRRGIMDTLKSLSLNPGMQQLIPAVWDSIYTENGLGSDFVKKFSCGNGGQNER